MPAQWLRATGDDRRQHVLLFREAHEHELVKDCICAPEVIDEVTVHAAINSATRQQRGKFLDQ
jgi:hypothetical protein